MTQRTRDGQRPDPLRQGAHRSTWWSPGRLVFSSLNVGLLRRILLVSVLFTLVVTAIQLYTDYVRDLEMLDKRVATLEKSQVPALALSIWQLDSELIETQLKSIQWLPDVHSVEVRTAYGEHFEVVPDDTPSRLRVYTFELTADRGQPVSLGSLTVTTDLGLIYAHLRQRLFVILATEGVRTFLLAFGILLIVQFVVTRHLAEIAAYLRDLRTDNLDRPLALDRHHNEANDELDVVVAVINGMRERLRRKLQALVEARRSLELSEEAHRLALDAAQDGLWDWDVESGHVTYSPAWCRILGEEQVEPIHASWLTRIHEQDRDAVLRGLSEHLTGHTDVWSAEHRMRRRDGTWAWVLGRGRVVKRSDDGVARRMVGTMTDISQAKEKEEVIWHQANYDALTGLPNRTLFHDLLGREIRFASRASEPLWVLFLDLDGFKEVNDVLGHQTGDLLLTQVARRLTLAVRDSDIVARLGGDEFVVILTGRLDSSAVDRVATKLNAVVAQSYDLNGQDVFVTTSIGIASYPHDASNAGDLIKFADQSMYEAKKHGKNQFHYFTPALEAASTLRMQISSDLRRGISGNEFELHYQPVIELSSGAVCKAEALLRWFHPSKGEISPAGFIPIAEETGVIVELGDWVFESALEQLADWQGRVCPDFQLSINVSPLQLRSQSDIQVEWLRRLDARGLRGGAVVIEITEGLLVEQEPRVAERLLRFREAGIQIAIDDFGTGYSSLAYLKKLDIDFLKIDKSFTQNLGADPTVESIVEAIIVMAQKLGLKVIAEGIETRAQRDFLIATGCDFGQGMFFARPMPVADFERFISETQRRTGS